MDDATPTPFQPQALSPEEDALEQNTREGLRALFHWAVFPYPLAVIPLGWGSQLPVFGFLFGGAAFAVLAVWAIRAYGAWGDRAWPFVAQVWETLFEKALTIASRGTLREYRFEGERAAHEEQARETTISLGLMAQAAADDPTQVRMASDIEHGAEARLSVLLGKPQLSLAEKRERDAIQMALQARRQSFEPTPNLPPPPQPMGGAPQGFLSPIPGFSFPFSWALAAVLAVTNLGTFWLWNGARSERDQAIEAAEQMAASNQRLTEALGDASQAHTVDTQRRIEQVRNEMEAIALEREREARRAALRRERNALENDPSLGPIDFGQRLPNLVEPASADGGGDGEPASPDPVGDVPG